MAEALAVLGAAAAAVQFAETSARLLIKTIRLVKDLKEVPLKLAKLLEEVETSTNHVDSLFLSLLQDDSALYTQVKSPAHLNGLVETITALQKATEEMNMFLAPMAEFKEGSISKGRRMARLWKSAVSLTMEKELSEKLERLNRLNNNVVRELSVVSLQVQITTNTLATVNNEISLRGFEELTRQLNALSVDVKNLHSSMTQRQSFDSSTDSEILKQDVSLTICKTTSFSSDASSEISLADSQHTLVSRTERSASAERRKAHLRLHLQQGLASSLQNTPKGRVIDSDLDLVLLTIRTYYTKGNFDPTPAMLQPRFWKDCSNSIYFFKVSDFPKARRLLQRSTAIHSDDIFTQGAATALIEILSTLSPVNTATNPDVRKTLLLYLHSLALKQLPRASPILVVLSRLHEGMGSKDWSLAALECIVAQLCATLPATNELRIHGQKRLIALLRRGKDYDKALDVCNRALDDVRLAAGEGSLQERKLARLQEHIYMDQGDWVSALNVCFDIVEQSVEETFGPNPDPQRHDECAIWTMEDIAKIYENNGNLAMSIAWLKQARISGGMCWGPDVSLEHIHDKLIELLRQCDKDEEAELWSTAFGPCVAE
ncbi:hypothetical protein VFPPC_07481 [Pochonia chlamydosporia 170]|uniref:Uncharacterized protein n=1 Tax=Pochonia chlamydosporia 170 TaxID=1380566 RepID=A0A179FKL4_METCM|nr:hypothetical protein VFPPC_07481 [Pochonia chlamydosporia 170]OAQ65837.1 hypothetical protein VFPPC_07481 [Pochonia chlamydosporia 170]